jgi:hypothetical protein
MWRNLTILLIVATLGGLEACGTTVNPGQRGAMVSTIGRLAVGDVELGLLLESSLERCVCL